MTNIDLMVLAGDYVKTAVISEWKVKVGDKVKKGDILLEVETNKITQGIEAPCDGVVEQILFQEGDDVEISKVIAVIGDGTGITVMSGGKEPEVKEEISAEAGARTVITPVAKKMAEEKGIDLTDLTKAFPGKRIGKKEIQTFMETMNTETSIIKPPSAGTDNIACATENKSILMKGLRKAVATAMRNSAYGKPHVSMILDAQLDEMLKMKSYLRSKYPERKISITGLLAFAVVKTLQEYPYMNGTSTEDTITLSKAVNLGIAVDVEGGLMVPVIKNSDALNGLDLFEEVNRVAWGCREGTLSPSDYAGGTFTISNVGATGVKYFTPIINSPEIAILGIGAAAKDVALLDGEIRERTMIGLSLSFDHAAVDGAPAGRFLKALKEKIEHPYVIAL